MFEQKRLDFMRGKLEAFANNRIFAKTYYTRQICFCGIKVKSAIRCA